MHVPCISLLEATKRRAERGARHLGGLFRKSSSNASTDCLPGCAQKNASAQTKVERVYALVDGFMAVGAGSEMRSPTGGRTLTPTAPQPAARIRDHCRTARSLLAQNADPSHQPAGGSGRGCHLDRQGPVDHFDGKERLETNDFAIEVRGLGMNETVSIESA
jgi:hypothetical protein